MRILYEIHVKNLYSNIKKEYRKLLTLEDLYDFNTVDPTSEIRRKEVAGNYLIWIVKDYFERVSKYGIPVNEYSSSDLAKDTYLLLNKFNSFSHKGYTSSKDIMKYTYDSLRNEIAKIEKENGEFIFNKARQGKDYDILVDDSSYTIYNVLTPEGSMFLGKGTKWCITKEDSFILDVREYIRQKFKILFIKSKKEKNSARNKNGDLMFPNYSEMYAIVTHPNGEFDEMVNVNNKSLFYSSDLEKLTGILIKYSLIDKKEFN